MSDAVVKVENLSKKYIIGHQKQERYTALRDVIGNSVKSILKPNSKSKNTKEEFWALKDLDFEINQGDRVGIIGRNGAGKSTLLKVLSRITEPTTGQIKIRGRVASLLEVGTGFHPELTGRENIFLNGAILGMGKVEIKKKFDEIVAFAEVEKFLDTPVKRYSSGMYVRLAFAVAAHLEPEILIVDEVLAVGDVQFQKKCLGKMEDVGKEGRTVIFVSHNMSAMKTLCQKGILLNEGKIVTQGAIDKAIDCYGGQDIKSSSVYIAPKQPEYPYFKKIEICQNKKIGNKFKSSLPIRIVFEVETYNTIDLSVNIVIRNSDGVWIHHSSSEFNTNTIDCKSRLRECSIPPYSLTFGTYYLDAFLAIRNYQLFEKAIDALKFEIYCSNTMPFLTKYSDWKGICAPELLSWK